MKKLLLGIVCLFSLSLNVKALTIEEIMEKEVVDGVFKIGAVKPDDISNVEFVSAGYFYDKYNNSEAIGYLGECNDDASECTLAVAERTGDFRTIEKKVKVVWAKSDAKIMKKVEKYIDRINKYGLVFDKEDTYKTYFEVKDLNLINYLANIKDINNINDINKIAYFAPVLRKAFENSNFNYYLDVRAGGDIDPMYDVTFGPFSIIYNGIVYDIYDVLAFRQISVIYIPDKTENTPEAYIAAAKKRIDDYLGNNDTKIEVAGKREGYIGEYYQDMGEDILFDWSVMGDEAKMGDYYYTITINGISKNFVIERNSKKMEVPRYSNIDMQTEVAISSDSANIPLDTNLSVNVLDENSKEYKEINDVLKLINPQMYDLKLYSKTADSYITKLDDGNFKVSIPITEELKDKDLIVYYVNDDNKVVEYTVKVENGMATFNTNHFSVYTLSEKPGDETTSDVPPTIDNIGKYIGLFLVSGGVLMIIRKKVVS